MSRMRILVSSVLAAAALAMTGCQSMPGVVIDKSKPIEQGGYTVVADEVSATETNVIVFGHPVDDLRGSPGRRLYKNALAKAPGADALIEYTMDTKIMNLSIVTIIWYTLTGTPVKTTK